MSTLWAILRAIAAVVQYVYSLKQIRKRERKVLEAQVAENNKAIAKGDEDKVNKRLDELFKLWIIVPLLALLMFGCVAPAKVIYIPQEDKAERVNYTVYGLLMAANDELDKIQPVTQTEKNAWAGTKEHIRIGMAGALILPGNAYDRNGWWLSDGRFSLLLELAEKGKAKEE